MQRLIIHNVGPIKDVDIELKKVNVFIGPQSSGKSTIAKVISFCSWLEKNKHEIEGSYLFNGSVKDKMVSYHRMEGYLQDDSQIFYQGDNIAFAYNIDLDKTKNYLKFKKGHYETRNPEENEYLFISAERLSNPKVLYIPAERNFVSIIPAYKLKKYDEYDDSLNSFIEDWFDAKQTFEKEKTLDLIDLGMKFYSDNNDDYIQLENGNIIRLRNASSGLQSVTLLLTVADYMTKGMYEKEEPFSQQEKEILDAMLHTLVVSPLTIKKDSNFRRRLEGFIQGKVYSHTQFVIEEPEQNLFPKEQYKLIEHLISIINHGKQHRMTISTHSPYIINFLNVLLRRPNDSESYISHENLNAYLVSGGHLTDLMMHDETEMKWAVDSTSLNAAMEDIAYEFQQLAK